MTKVPYSKPALSYIGQLQQLKDRGLHIEDEDKAIHLLQVISYYRLSGYWYPLLANKAEHQFKSGSSFDQAFKIYCFDRELRLLILRELEKIEVAVRARMIYVISELHGPFWFQKPELFTDPDKHEKALVKIQEEFRRSDEDFITAFKAKYSDPLPPSWMMLEITSFGTLSMLFKNLKPGREKREIAHSFGLADSVFETWLHSIVYLRNVCAHHTRLWNRVLSIAPQFPRRAHKPWLVNAGISNKRSFFILSMILYLLQSLNPKNSLVSRVKALLDKYPSIDVRSMGFPDKWKEENLWQEN